MKQSRGLLLAAVAVASVLGVGAIFSTVLKFSSAGGSLTPYLIGSFNGKDHDCWGVACGNFSESNTTETVVRLVNPTNLSLKAYVALYDRVVFIACKDRALPKNSYAEVNLVNDVGTIFDSHDLTIKVLTVDFFTNKVQAGVKGWITHFFAVTMDDSSRSYKILQARESQLQGVPIQVAQATEADKIIKDCTTP